MSIRVLIEERARRATLGAVVVRGPCRPCRFQSTFPTPPRLILLICPNHRQIAINRSVRRAVAACSSSLVDQQEHGRKESKVSRFCPTVFRKPSRGVLPLRSSVITLTSYTIHHNHCLHIFESSSIPKFLLKPTLFFRSYL